MIQVRSRARPLATPLLYGAAFLATFVLVTAGVLGLWSGMRDEELKAQLEARRSSERIAKNVLDQLLNAGPLPVADVREFTFEDAVPVAGKTPSPVAPPGTTPPDVAALLDALVIEGSVTEHDLKDLEIQMARHPAMTRAENADAAWTAFAWVAHRAGLTASRDTALARLTGPTPGGLLLGLTCDRLEPPLSFAPFGALSDAEAAALMQRARSCASETSRAIVEDAIAEETLRRRVLQRAMVHREQLLNAEEGPRLLSIDEEWFLRTATSDPSWIFLDRSALEDVLTAVTESSADGPLHFTFGPAQDGAVPIAQGIALLQRAPKTPQKPWFLALALTGLGVMLMGGLALLLRTARRRTEAAELREEFVTSVSHELKTPLSSIRLLLEMLEGGRVPSERVPEYHRLLSGEASRLTMLIENVLDLRRVERGERGLDLRRVDLDALVDETLLVFTPLAQKEGLRVARTNAESGAWVTIDRDAGSQILLNLLDNARKYAASGGVIEVLIEVDREHATLRVRDHGPGVSAEDRERLCERFTRGVGSEHSPGVGLGLYLARELARAQGGRLTLATPSDGQGLSVAWTMPRAEEIP